MADEKTIILKLELEVARSKAKIARLKEDIESLDMRFNKNKVKSAELAVEYNKLSEAQSNLANKTRSLANANKEFIGDSKTGMTGASKATGAYTASALEVGRVISDMPYGIRGVANNLSQLASNMVYATKAAGGFTLAIKGLFSALRGPLGILIAIQSVIAAWDYFGNKTEEVEGKVDNLNKSLQETLDKFRMISMEALSLYDDVFIGQIEDSATALKILRNEFDEFDNKLKELEDNKQDTPENVGELISKYQELLSVRVSINKEEERIKGLRSGDIEDPLGIGVGIATSERNIINLLSKKADLEEFFEVKREEKEKKSLKNTLKNYKQNLLDQSKIRNDLERDDRVSREQNELEILKITQEYERRDLELSLNNFKEKERLRYESFMNSKATEEEKMKATKLHNETIISAELEHEKTLTQMKLTQAAERFQLAFELARQYNDQFRDAAQDGQLAVLEGIGAIDTGVDKLENDKDILDQNYQYKLSILEQEIEDRRRANMEYADLTAKKHALEQRYENDSLKLKRKVESTKMGIVLQGLDVVKQIAGEGSAVGKAAGVAMATISTYEAATAALGAKPYGPWNIAQAAIVTAAGLANVRSILNTKIPDGGRSGGSTAPQAPNQGREFDFNLVGSTGTNQLAQVVGGQVGQSIRAYVVSSEITNQQQLDNQIQGNATIGD